MSSATTQNCRVASVTYSFPVQWTLKGKELIDLSEEGSSNVSAIQSDLYQFKAIKELRFYLEIPKLLKKSRYFSLEIKGSKMWSFELDYAFLASKETVLGLKMPNQLSFLSLCNHSSVLDAQDVTICCVVIAYLVHPAPSAKEDDLSLQEGQNTVEFEGIPDFTLPSNYQNESVINFIGRGIIPNLTIDMAIKIIAETKEHKCEVLKVLCVEYLMKNITGQSLRKILKAAKDHSLSLLENKCTEQIINGYFQIK